jgi:hypothetical protein
VTAAQLAALAELLHLRGPAPASLERRARLVAQAAVLEGVDPALALAVCVMESGMRVRSPRASLCGCQPYTSGDAAQATCAARSLRAGMERCGSAEGAVSRYVWGRCAPSRGRTARRAWWRAHVLGYLRRLAVVRRRIGEA